MVNYETPIPQQYFVDDLPGAKLPATRITKLLERIDKGLSISSESLMYLENLKLISLKKYAEKEVSLEEFYLNAKEEQLKRIKKAELDRLLKKEKERQETTPVMERESLTNHNSMQSATKQQKKKDDRYLKDKYDLSFYIEKNAFHRLSKILRIIDSGRRISEIDFLWLSTEGADYFTKELKKALNYIEAQYYEKKFFTSQNVWMAISASSHYRKCGMPKQAAVLLNGISLENIRSKKLKSAVYTTFGGVKRDIGNHALAINFAMTAHNIADKDFRPCTLLGALYMESGQVSLGYHWYDEAIKRGASERSIDSDIRRIYFNANREKRSDIYRNLISLDPERFHWIKNL